jgi:Spy/CpxP family protein refolding chaperone
VLKKTALLIAAALLLWAAPAAQAGPAGPAGKWWRLPRVADDLQLTESEKLKLDDLQLEFRRKRIQLKSRREQTQLVIDSYFDRPVLDEAAIRAQFAKMAQTQAEISLAQSNFLLGIRKLLGLERFGRLRRLFNEFRRNERLRDRPPRRRPPRFRGRR